MTVLALLLAAQTFITTLPEVSIDWLTDGQSYRLARVEVDPTNPGPEIAVIVGLRLAVLVPTHPTKSGWNGGVAEPGVCAEGPWTTVPRLSGPTGQFPFIGFVDLTGDGIDDLLIHDVRGPARLLPGQPLKHCSR